MGTAISLDLADDLPPATLHELADEVFAWLREVDARFSTYRTDSEVCRFDRGEVLLSEASADLRLVLERCADLWGATDGFFDAYATGRLDPSGYVKGWAAQVASDRLLAAGAANHCVNAGGDVRVRGRSPPAEPWRIGVRHPWDPTATCLVLTGTDLAVATSGVYERGQHVLDPRRGAPARGLRSVTVVGAGPRRGRRVRHRRRGDGRGRDRLAGPPPRPPHARGHRRRPLPALHPPSRHRLSRPGVRVSAGAGG